MNPRRRHSATILSIDLVGADVGVEASGMGGDGRNKSTSRKVDTSTSRKIEIVLAQMAGARDFDLSTFRLVDVSHAADSLRRCCVAVASAAAILLRANCMASSIAAFKLPSLAMFLPAMSNA